MQEQIVSFKKIILHKENIDSIKQQQNNLKKKNIILVLRGEKNKIAFSESDFFTSFIFTVAIHKSG